MKTNGFEESTETLRWFAVRTRPKSEKWIQQKLEKAQIQTYLPLRKVFRTYQRKKKTVFFPLIQGYLFVKIKKTDYISILQMPNVTGFLSYSSGPAPIPEKEIQLLRKVVGDFTDCDVISSSFQKGDQVEVIAGELTGLQGQVLKTAGKSFLLIELRTIGFSLRIQIQKEFLRPCEAQP